MQGSVLMRQGTQGGGREENWRRHRGDYNLAREFPGTCHMCHKMGHEDRHCQDPKTQKAKGKVVQVPSPHAPDCGPPKRSPCVQPSQLEGGIGASNVVRCYQRCRAKQYVAVGTDKLQDMVLGYPLNAFSRACVREPAVDVEMMMVQLKPGAHTVRVKLQFYPSKGAASLVTHTKHLAEIDVAYYNNQSVYGSVAMTIPKVETTSG